MYRELEMNHKYKYICTSASLTGVCPGAERGGGLNFFLIMVVVRGAEI